MQTNNTPTLAQNRRGFKLFINFVGADVVEYRAIFYKFNKDAVIARYPKRPKARKRAVKFVRIETWVKRVLAKNSIFSVNDVLNVARQFFVGLAEIGSIVNARNPRHIRLAEFSRR